MILESGKYYGGVGFLSPHNNSIKIQFDVKDIDETRIPRIGFYKFKDFIFKIQYADEYEGENFAVIHNETKHWVKFKEATYQNPEIVSI